MSSDRNLDAGTAAAVTQPHFIWFPLVQMDFDTGTVRVCGLDHDVEYPAGSGTMWTASRGFGSMEAITETSDSVEGLKFTLAGIPLSAVVEAQEEKYQGRKCTVMMAFVVDGLIHVDPVTWVGRMDVPTIKRSAGSCTITVTAEHAMADWRRPREFLYNSVSQKRDNPADTFFDGIENAVKTEWVLFSRAARTI